MIVVTVEVWPVGDVTRRRVIASMTIANVTPGSIERPDGTAVYRVVVDGEPLPGRAVTHRRADGPWPLVRRALRRLR